MKAAHDVGHSWENHLYPHFEEIMSFTPIVYLPFPRVGVIFGSVLLNLENKDLGHYVEQVTIS